MKTITYTIGSIPFELAYEATHYRSRSDEPGGWEIEITGVTIFGADANEVWYCLGDVIAEQADQKIIAQESWA